MKTNNAAFKTLLAGIIFSISLHAQAMKTTPMLSYEKRIQLGEQLVLAAEEESNNRVRELLDMGIDINYSSYTKGWPALQAAVNRGNLATVQMLILTGADIHAASHPNYETALMECAQFGYYPEILKLLLQSGASTDANKYGRSALTEAIEEGVVTSFARKWATSEIRLEHIAQLSPIQRESVKNWLLLTKKMKSAFGINIPKDLRRMIAQYLCKSFAQDLLEKVVVAGAPRALRHAKHHDQAYWSPFTQLLENHMNLDFLEELVKRQTLLPKQTNQ